jgi:hypothetical protein
MLVVTMRTSMRSCFEKAWPLLHTPPTLTPTLTALTPLFFLSYRLFVHMYYLFVSVAVCSFEKVLSCYPAWHPGTPKRLEATSDLMVRYSD